MFNDLAQHTNFVDNLVAVGMAVSQKMVMPPEILQMPLGEILMRWSDLYKLQHRGEGNIGYVRTEQISETHYKTIHDNMYPDDMAYGIAYGMAKRWLSKGTQFLVQYDSDVPHKDVGGDITIIHVKWG